MGYRDTTQLHGWPDDDELDRLRAEYSNWRFWRGMNEQRQPTGWYCTRRQEVPDAHVAEGVARTLGGDTPEELRAHLATQARLEATLANLAPAPPR